LGETAAAESAKQADKSNASSKVHASPCAVHAKARLEKIKAAGLFGQQGPGFVHQLVLESAGVGVECDALEAQPSACAAPSRDGGEDFAQDAFRGGGFDAKAFGDSSFAATADALRHTALVQAESKMVTRGGRQTCQTVVQLEHKCGGCQRAQ